MTRPDAFFRTFIHCGIALIAAMALLVSHVPLAYSQQSRTQGEKSLSDIQMLMIGSESNRIDVILHVLAKGIDVNTRARGGYTPLMAAAGEGAMDAMELLLARGADVNLANDAGWTALMEAIRGEHVRAVELLMQKGARTDVRENQRGQTPLMLAAKTDRIEIATLLLKAGADVNAVDTKRGITALHFALDSTKDRGREIAAELLINGAKASIAAPDGFTPLMAAADSGKLPRVSLILSEKVDVNAETETGETALSMAAGNGDVEIVSSLLRAGAKTSPTKGTHTPLSEAVRSGNADTVRALLDAKANTEATAARGRTPLIIAAQNGHDKIVELLLERGADVNGRSAEDGSTPLMWAANNGRKRIVELLIERGADIGLVANDGWSAAEAANMAGHEEIARMLEQKI